MKRVTLDLVGLGGNAHAIMDAFSKQAKHEGWPQDEINSVLYKATSGDYDNLLTTIGDHCEQGEKR